MKVQHLLTFVAMFRCAIFGTIFDAEPVPQECPNGCSCDFVENTLDCSEGNLTHLPQGIDQNVTSINLSFNKFNGLPNELEKLGNLRRLDLSYNPDIEFMELDYKSVSVRNLQMRGCSISYIDNIVFKGFPNLEILNLSENPMTFLNSTLVSTSLKSLNLSKCHMRHIKPQALLSLPTLLYFSLSNNRNLRQFHCESSSILTLDISNCNLEHVPSGALRKVLEMDLHGNNIQWLRNRSFVHSLNIENLNISYNSIRSIDVNSISHLSHLTVIDLSYNRINVIEQNTFKRNERLKALHLSHNYLKTIDGITSDTIQLLDLSSCEINYLRKYSFKHLPALSELHLRRNLISHIPDNIDAPHLVYLDLSYNGISTLSNETFVSLKYLRFLMLSGNKLTTITPTFFPQIIELMIEENPWLCDCDALREIYHWMIRTDQSVSFLRCQLPAKLEGLTWEEACYNAWSKPNVPQRSVWWYSSSFFIILGFLLLLIYISKKMDQHRKQQAEQQNEERREAERQEFIQRQQTRERLRQLEVQEESRNAPDPRELQSPPTYTEALMLPRLDASHPSLAGSLHSLSSCHTSNPDLAKRGRGRQRRKRRRRKSLTPPRSRPSRSNPNLTDASDNDVRVNATEFEESSF